MAKRVRISDDGGTTWFTLPGSSGELQNEAGDIQDTVFGQDYASTQTGLIGWTVNANGLFKGFAGYVAKLMKTGTATLMTDEPMSVVTGQTYQITATSKRVLDRFTAIIVEDNNIAVPEADIESYDHLFGQVTFKPGYTVTGPVTISGKYLPLASIGSANGFTLTQTVNAIDDTTFDIAQATNGFRSFRYGLKTVALEVSGIYSQANAFAALLASRAELVIEINPDGNGKSVARGFFKPMSQGQSGDVGDLEQETVSFSLSVPDDQDVALPFKWMHASDTTLNVGLQKALKAYTDSDVLTVAYIPDGATGVQGDCIITDLSLSSGMEAMNEFTVNVQGVEALAPYSGT